MSRPLVYVAGPYSTGDPVTNTQDAIRAGEDIWAMGGCPLVPHLSMLWHLVSPKPLVWWYRYDLELLERCDALLRLPGPSAGADNEVSFALDHGIPVFVDLGELRAWIAEETSDDAAGSA